MAALHSIFAQTDSLKLYVTMLIGYAENAVHLHLSLSQCLKLLISKRLFFKNSVVKIAGPNVTEERAREQLVQLYQVEGAQPRKGK